MPPDREPFDIRSALPFLDGDGWRGGLRRALDELLGLTRVRAAFREAEESGDEPFAASLRAFGLEVQAKDFTEAVPASGPVVVMANHPFGGADALSLGALCRAKRPDTLLMANEMAAQLPVLGKLMLPLSILGGEGSARKNAASLRRSLEHLRGGGLLAVFPSGEVANWKGSAVEESPWSPHISALAERCGAKVILVRFFGKTPAWFHLGGGIHPMVRTALLPRVLLAMRGSTVQCRAEAVSPDGYDGKEAAAFFRKRTLAMEE
jgi:putative hemolysin